MVLVMERYEAFYLIQALVALDNEYPDVRLLDLIDKIHTSLDRDAAVQSNACRLPYGS